MNDFVRMIFSELKSGLILAAFVVMLAVTAITVAYIIHKKLGKEVKFPLGRTIVVLLLAAVTVVILYATLMRSSGYGGMGNLHFLRAWREAWNNYSMKNWLNLLLNVAMFVPIGLLLPIIHRIFEKWYVMLGVGLAATLVIELVQLITRRGLFDVDDIAANALGTMIGYCLIMVFRCAVSRRKSWIAYAALPASAVLFLAGTVIVYNVQPYGNLEIAPNYTIKTSGVEWQLDFTPSDAPATGAVYKSETYDKSSCDAFAEEFFERIGAAIGDISYYDDETWYINHAGGDSLVVNHRDRSYDYTYISRDESSFSAEDKDMALACLAQMGVSVPQGAEYSYDSEGSWHVFEIDFLPDGERILNGSLRCRITEDGKIVKLRNNLCDYEFVVREELITESEAAGLLQKGKFNGEYFEYADPELAQVKSVTLSYRIDSKGFLQPTYMFEIALDGGIDPVHIEIPALR